MRQVFHLEFTLRHELLDVDICVDKGACEKR